MTKTHRFPLAMLIAFSLGICSSTGCSQEQPDGAESADSGGADAVPQQAVVNQVDANAASEGPVEAEPEPLLIGSPAPRLDIGYWIQDGGGHFSKVTEFEADKVYVVEFWATWCSPCIASMPHIAALQRDYADRGVQVVSITREDPGTVEEFLDRDVRGAKGEVRGAKEGDEIQTYRDLTSGYCLTADPDNSTSRDYMLAAKQGGIPCAFIVGKDARIEWIGHPMSMDEPLEQVVTDSWNRDAFAEKLAAERAVNAVAAQAFKEARSGKIDSAVAILDSAMQDPKLSSQKSTLGTMKFKLLASNRDAADEAAEVALELLDDESLDASGVNAIAWTIYEYSAAKRFHDEEVIQAAINLSQGAIADSADKKPYLLYTIAHLHHALGDLETALTIQQSAVEAADAALKPQVTPFLRQLWKEIEAKNAAVEEESETAAEDAESADES